MQRTLGRRLIVILDRLPARSAAKRLRGDQRFVFEWLPGYAPDLNPVEPEWSHTKFGDMANFVPEDLIDLEIETALSLNNAHTNPKVLRSFFQAARLKL